MAQWSVEVTAATDDLAGDLPADLMSLLEDAARHVLREEGAGECDLSVTLVSDEMITDLNRDYLGRDRVTDVIAFPLRQPGTPLLGDVYIGLDQARRQAEELGIEFVEEVVRLVVHGTLHVLDWDHPEGEERFASPMFQRQEELVQGVLGRS